MNPYFPSDYFGATGLAGLIEGGPFIPPPVVDDTQLSDAQCLIWVKGTLAESGLFGWTGIGKVPTIQTNQDYPSAWIYPISFNELDDVDPEMLTRKLNFAIQVLTSPDDYGDDLVNMTALDKISNAVANLISQGPPGTLPGWSRIENGKYDVIPLGTTDKPAIGTQCSGIYLYGTMAYLIPGRDVRDELDPYD
jgi:hypothetical protein